MSLRLELPNLELLEYKIRIYLSKNESFMNKFETLKAENKSRYFSLQFEMFPQSWGNTSGGFEGIGGSAITSEYTSVVHESMTNTFIICFGEMPCYIVENPNEVFLSDLKNRNIKGLHTAEKFY